MHGIKAKSVWKARITSFRTVMSFILGLMFKSGCFSNIYSVRFLFGWQGGAYVDSGGKQQCEDPTANVNEQRLIRVTSCCNSFVSVSYWPRLNRYPRKAHVCQLQGKKHQGM